MKTRHFAILLLASTFACDQAKPTTSAAPSAKPSAGPVATTAVLAMTASATAPRAKKECVPPPALEVTTPGLEAELRRKIGKDAGALTTDDLAKVKSINLTVGAGGTLDELDPCVFPYLKNVKDIFLGQGNIKDLKPLEGLNQVITLRAANNPISDLKPLTKLAHLDRLDLSKTAITDIDVVRSMPDLTELQIDGTHVSDLSPLAACTKLEQLSIKETLVKDLSALKNLKNLKKLWIAGSPIESTTPVEPLKAKGLKLFLQ